MYGTCIKDWHVSDVLSFSNHMYVRYTVQSSTKRTKMIRNIRCTSWNKYVSELEQKLCELNRVPVSISSIDDIEALASTVQSEIMKSYNLACPMRKIRRKTENIWWNTELAGLCREARKVQRKAIKYKLENKVQRKAIRKAKRDSWRLFTESMNSHCATAQLAKIMCRKGTSK